MHDLFIIFVILLVLLTFISTFGGSIYAKETYNNAMMPMYSERFEYEEGGDADGGAEEGEEDVDYNMQPEDGGEYDAEVEEYREDEYVQPEMPDMMDTPVMDTPVMDTPVMDTPVMDETPELEMPTMMPPEDMSAEPTMSSLPDLPTQAPELNLMDTVEGFDGDMYAAF